MTPNLDDSGMCASSEAPVCRLPSPFSSLRRQQPPPDAVTARRGESRFPEWGFRVWGRVEGEKDIKGREWMNDGYTDRRDLFLVLQYR